MDKPRFLPNDEVFAIPESESFRWIGTYKISAIRIVPKEYSSRNIPSEEMRYEYYATVAQAMYREIILKHVFKDKDEFMEFVKDFKFEYNSPK